jgi:uncharacterized protein YicC (UPF0701 family)
MVLRLHDLRARILENLAYLIVYAPNYPAWAHTTTEEQFSKLLEMMQSFHDRSRDSDRKVWLDLALQDTRDALRAFTEGRDHEGIMLIQHAEQHFRDYLRKRSVGPTFVVSSDGSTEKQ